MLTKKAVLKLASAIIIGFHKKVGEKALIYSLKGKLLHKSANEAVIELSSGISFSCKISASTFYALKGIGEEAFLYTYMKVSENDVELIGFANIEEKSCFVMLNQVNGVGPKAALAILSCMSANDVAVAAMNKDAKAFSRAQGVGPKLASRIVLELHDKVSSTKDSDASFAPSTLPQTTVSASNAQNAINALCVLGYSNIEASNAVKDIDLSLSTEQIIAEALRKLNSNN